MQVYALKLHNFLRFGDSNNSIVFDLTPQQKKDLAIGAITMDEIYNDFSSDPVGHIENANARGIEREIGLIGIVEGDSSSSNGAGKSSILEAICYAHYEKIVRKTANNDKIEKAGLSVVTKINRKYPDNLSESYVEEYFEDNGSIYRIKRGRSFSKSHKSSTPILEFDCIKESAVDRRGSHRKSDTAEAIADVITMDYDVFVNSQMFGQSDAGKFLTGTDKTRKEMIISLLMLENVVSGCLDLIRKKKNAQDKKVESIKANTDFIKESICQTYSKYTGKNDIVFSNTISDEIITLLCGLKSEGNEKLNKCKLRIDDLKKDIESLSNREEITKVSKIKEEGTRVKNQIASVEKEKKDRVADIQAILDDGKSQIAKIESDIKSKDSRLASINSQIEKMTDQINEFDEEGQIKRLKSLEGSSLKRDSIKAEITKLNLDRDELVSKIAGHGSRKNILLEEIKSLQIQINNVQDGEEFVCDKCKSKVSKEHILHEIEVQSKNVADIESNVDKLSDAKVSIDNILSDKQKDLHKVNEDIVLESTIKGAISTHKAVKNNVNDIKKNRDELTQDIDSNLNRIKENKVKNDQYVEKIQNLTASFDEELIKLNKQIVQLTNDYKSAIEAAKKVKEEINEKNQLMDKVNEVKSKTVERLGFLDRDITHHEEVNSKLKEKEAEFQIETKTLNRYALLETVYGLDGIQTRIVRKYLPLLNVYIKEFLDILSNGAINVEMVVNDKSKIDMIIDGGSADSYEMLSGGEKMIVRVAVDIGMALLSFSRSSQKPEIICLDEIFGCLDENRKDAVLKMLRKLQDKFSRVIIISHDKEICDQLSSKIIIEKNGGAFGLSKISRIE